MPTTETFLLIKMVRIDIYRLSPRSEPLFRIADLLLPLDKLEKEPVESVMTPSSLSSKAFLASVYFDAKAYADVLHVLEPPHADPVECFLYFYTKILKEESKQLDPREGIKASHYDNMLVFIS